MGTYQSKWGYPSKGVARGALDPIGLDNGDSPLVATSNKHFELYLFWHEKDGRITAVISPHGICQKMSVSCPWVREDDEGLDCHGPLQLHFKCECNHAKPNKLPYLQLIISETKICILH